MRDAIAMGMAATYPKMTHGDKVWGWTVFGMSVLVMAILAVWAANL